MPDTSTFLSAITGSFSTPAADNPTVAMIEDRALVGGPLPENLSRISIHADDLEGMAAIASYGVGMLELLALVDVFDCLFTGDDGPFNCRSQEDPIAPDDGRGMAAARQRRFPLDIRRLPAPRGRATAASWIPSRFGNRGRTPPASSLEGCRDT